MYITVLIKIIVYGNGTAKTILKTDRVIQENIFVAQIV